MDLHRRSMTGIIVYAIMLPAVFWPFDFHTKQPDLSFAFALSMLMLSILRATHWLATDHLYRVSPIMWLSTFTMLSLAQAGVLGVFFAMAMFDPRFDPILHVTMLAIGGIASSALVALTPRITLALFNLGALLLPSIIVGCLYEGKLPYAIMITVYACFIGLMGIRSSKEYTRSFEIETQLDDQKKVLEQLNKIDALTNIYNRGYFDIEFRKQWQNGHRLNVQLTLMLIDIDHFKLFNDNYGHLCGDACIIHVAKIISQIAKRQTDIVARFGGEEFVVVLSGYALHESAKMAEKVRRSVEQKAFIHENREHSVTVSIGVCTLIPNNQMDPKTIIENADEAMYTAKKSGRNKVVTYTNS